MTTFRIISVLALILLSVSTVEGSHFRGSSISSSLDSSGNLTVTVYAVWRSTFIGGVSVKIHSDSDMNRNINLLTMTQTSVEVTETGFEYPGGQAFTVRKHTFKNNITGLGAGTYVARWQDGNRVANIVNVGQTKWGVEAKFTLTSPVTASSSPTMVPATVDMIAIGQVWSQNLFAVDPDGSPLSYEFIIGSTKPEYGVNFNIPGLSIDTSNGQLNISAANTATLLNERRYAYKVRVTDGSGSYAERDVLVVARNTNGNNAPVIASLPDISATVGDNISVAVTATDADATDVLTLRMTTTPPGSAFPVVSTVSPATSTFTWNSASPAGIYTASFDVFDTKSPAGTIMVDSEQFTITLSGNNQFPVLTPIGNQYTPFPGTLTFTISGSDAETASANLTYAAFFLPTGATFNPATRVFSWTPSGSQNGSVYTGIVFRVTDDDATTPLYDEEMIAISVNANQSPSLAAIANTTTVLGATFNQVFTSTDPDGDIVTLSLPSGQSGSTFTTTSGTTATGNLTWTPAAIGSYSFTLRATDNGSPNLSQNQTFTLAVILNTTPTVPTSLSPISGLVINDPTPTMSFELDDADGHQVKYQIQVGQQASLSTPLIDYTSVLQSTGSAIFTVGQSAGSGSYTTGTAGQSLSSGNYYWHVRAIDSFGAISDYSSSGNSSIAFVINSTPSTPTLTSPVTGAYISSTPTFSLTTSDPDGDQVRYHIEVSSDSGFSSLDYQATSSFTAAGAQSTSPGSFNAGIYYWRAKSEDISNSTSAYATANGGGAAFIIDTAPSTPTSLTILSTDHGTVVHTQAPSFSFTLSDSDSNVGYRIIITSGATTVVDYTSGFFSPGTQTFTVGQSPLGGSYTTGSIGQNLASGNYQWTLQAISEFGQTSSTSSASSFSVNTPPVVSNMNPNNPNFIYRTNENPTFSFDISDSDGDLIDYQVIVSKLDGTQVYSTGPGNLETASSFIVQTTPLTSTGNYFWTVQTTDANSSASAITYATGPGFQVLSQTPSAQILSPNIAGTTSPGGPMYTFQIDDPDNDPIKYEVVLSTFPETTEVGNYTSPAFVTEGTQTLSSSNVQTSTRGDYVWKVSGFDSAGPINGAGNVAYSTDTTRFAFSINNSPNTPSSLTISNSFTDGANVFVNSTSPVFNFTISDSDPDPVKYRLIIDDTSDFSSPVIDFTTSTFADVYSYSLPSSNLIGHWPLDEIISTTTPDLTTAANHMETGGTIAGTGVSGRAFHFDGVDDAVLTQTGDTTSNLPQFTMMGWIKPERVTSKTGLFVQSGVIGLFFNGVGNQVQLYAGGPNVSAVANYTISANIWTHIAAVGTGTKMSIFINGTESGFVNHAQVTAPTWYGDNANKLRLGDNFFDATGVKYKGYMDDVRLYDVSMNAATLSTFVSNVPTSTSANVVHQIGSTGSNSDFLHGIATTTLSGARYYYRIQAIDAFENTSSYLSGNFVSNTTPAAATLQSPILLQTTSSSQPVFTFIGEDSDSNTMYYTINISSDTGFTNSDIIFQSTLSSANVVSFQAGQATGGGSYQTGQVGQSLNHGWYNWKVGWTDEWGFSGTVTSASSGNAFAINQSPVSPTLTSPQASSLLRTTTPGFIFTTSDPDGDLLTYTLSIDDDSNFATPLTKYSDTPASLGSLNFTYGQAAGSGSYLSGNVGDSLSSGNYFWRVTVSDNFSDSAGPVEATTAPGSYAFQINESPTAPTGLSPTSGLALSTQTPTFGFTLSDPESDQMTYLIQITSDVSFSTFDISYRSTASNPGTKSYTPGDAGTYLAGSGLTALLQGSYYWRVSAFDIHDSVNGVTTTANSGAIAFSLDTSPVLSAVAEIKPGGVIQATQSTYTMNLATIHSTTSTGFNRLQINLPAGFSYAASPGWQVSVGGSAVAFTSSISGSTSTLLLGSPITANASVEIKVNLNNPVSASIGTVSLSLDHTSHGELYNVPVGDGDGLNDGGSLKIQVQASGPVLLALAEVLPVQTTQATNTDFNWYIHATMDATTSGVDQFVLDIPSGYQVVHTGNVFVNGAAITYTSSVSATQMQINTPTLYTATTKFQLETTLRAPLSPGSTTFTGQVRTSSDSSATNLIAGDGNQGGDGGSLTVTTVSAGAALKAQGEITPDVVIKGSTGEQSTLYIYSEHDPSTSGINQISFSLSSELSNIKTGHLRFAGSTIAHTTSISGQNVIITLSSLNNLTGVYSLELTFDTSSSIGVSTVNLLTVKNTNSSESKSVISGDGDQNGLSGDLILFRMADGPAITARSELSPNTLIKGDLNNSTLYTNITVIPKNSGFNRMRFMIPHLIEQTTFMGVKWNGTSIQYSSASQTIQLSSNPGDENGTAFYVQTASLLSTSGILSIDLQMKAENEEETDTIKDFYIAYSTDANIIYSTTAVAELTVIDGDGDGDNNNGTLNIELKAIGPASDTNAEILPRVFTKGVTSDFHYKMNPIMDNRHSGINYIELSMPEQMTASSLLDVNVGNSSWIVNSTSFSGNTFKILLSTVSSAAVIDLHIQSLFTGNAGQFPISGANIGYTTLSSLSQVSGNLSSILAEAGDGDGLGDGGFLSFKTLPAGPAIDIQSEIQPNRTIKGSTKQFSYYYNIDVDASSSGVDTLQLVLPSSFGSASLLAAKVNGSSVFFSNQSGTLAGGETFLKAKLNAKVTTDAILSIDFNASLPSSPINEVLGNASVDDSTFTQPRAISLGDGDGKGDGGSLEVDTVAKAVVISAISEIQPPFATKSTRVSLKYITTLDFDTQTSGLNALSMTIPFTYSNLVLNNILHDGSSISYSSSFASTILNITLGQLIDEDATLTLEFDITAPGIEGTEVFPGLTLKNTSENLVNTSLAGDGDGLNDGGTLTVQTVAAGPAASATAEIKPLQSIKGSNQVDYTLYMRYVLDSSSSSIKRIVSTLPLGFSSPVIRNVKVGGSSVAYTGTTSNTQLDITLTNAIAVSGDMSIEFRINNPTTVTSEAFQPIVIYDSLSRSLNAKEGRASNLTTAPHQWSVQILSSGAGRNIQSEVSPTVAQVNVNQEFTLHNFITQDSTTSSVKRVTLDFPSTFKNVQLLTVQKDGSSVPFTHSIVNNQLEVLLTQELTTTALLNLIFSATPTQTGKESLSSGVAWHSWTNANSSLNIKSNFNEGDGDRGGSSVDNTWTIDVRSTSVLLRALAEISPNVVPVNRSSLFTYYISLQLSANSTGVDLFTLTLPSGYTGLQVQAVKWEGSSIKHTNLSTSTQIKVQLPEKLTSDGVLAVTFKATSPTLSRTDKFSLAKIGLASSTTLSTVEEGDGDGKGFRGSNSLSVRTTTNPPVASATTEIYPNIGVLNTATTFHLLFRLEIDALSAGVDALQFELPASFSGGSLDALKFSDQNIAHTSSFGSSVFYTTPTHVINQSGILEAIFTTTPTLGYGTDKLPLPILKNGSVSMLPVIADADGSSLSPRNNLDIEQVTAGPVERVEAEIYPNIATLNTAKHRFDYHAFIKIGKSPDFTGFDTFELDIPTTFKNARLLSVKLDGSSVAYTNQSTTQKLKARLTNPVNSNATVSRERVLSLQFDVSTPSLPLSEEFSSFKVYKAATSSFFTSAREGDGDRGLEDLSSQSWKVRTVAGVPSSLVQAEVYPNQFVAGTKNVTVDLYVYADVDVGNTGITTLEVGIPASMTLKSKLLKINDTIVGDDLSTSTRIKFRFNPTIFFPSKIHLQLKVDMGTTALSDSFSDIVILDAQGRKVRAIEGDGDQSTFNRASDSWSFEVVSTSLASRIETQISPHAFTTGAIRIFNYVAHVQMGTSDVGFDTIHLGLPNDLSQVTYLGTYLNETPGPNPDTSLSLASSFRVTPLQVLVDGTALPSGSLKSSVPPLSSSGFQIRLNKVVRQSALLEIRFSAQANAETGEEIAFTHFSVSNSLFNGITQTAIQGNPSDWSSQAFVPRSVLQAVAEVTPNEIPVANVNATPQTFSLYFRTYESSATGFNRIQFSYPVTYQNFKFIGLFHRNTPNGNNSTVQLLTTPTVVSDTVTIDLQKAFTAGWFELRFSLTPPAFSGSERFSLFELTHRTNSSPVQISEGDSGLNPSSTLHSLKVKTRLFASIQNLVAEISPAAVQTPVNGFNFEYQVKAIIPVGSDGFDYISLVLPIEMINGRLWGITLDGSRVLYEDQSYYSNPSYQIPVGGQAGGALALRLPLAINKNTNIVLFISADLRPYDKTIKLDNFYVSKFPLFSNPTRPATAGDGGKGISNNWNLKLNPPASGIRPLTDYPLIVKNSGDYAMPLLIGFGLPGEQVQIFDQNNISVGQSRVDGSGFYIVRTKVLAPGSHTLTAKTFDLSTALTQIQTPRSHEVIQTSAIPSTDLDGDGISDYDDADDDGDGILDIFDAKPLNTDNDDLDNSVDPDDDNDGVFDTIEERLGTLKLNPDTNADGILDDESGVDTDGDGLVDAADPFPNISSSLSDLDGDGIPDALDNDDDGDLIPDKIDLHPYDTDRDGLNNALDNDDDDDGVSDLRELELGTKPLNKDSNSDGVNDLGLNIDSDHDGLIDDLDPWQDLNPTFGFRGDLDLDGTPDAKDQDMDGDGIPNKNDLYPADYDNDGRNRHFDNDQDNDGIEDRRDISVSESGLSLVKDSDNDGLPNELDPDDDGDQILDIDEPGFERDANQDGNIDGLGQVIYHGDRDGVMRIQEERSGTDWRNSDTNGDGSRDTGDLSFSGDQDGDGISDEIDPDPNTVLGNINGRPGNFTILDFITSIPGGSNDVVRKEKGDPDDDGILNIFDIFPYDSNNDGVGNASDDDDDGDGIPDSEDTSIPDSDNDGIPNSEEQDSDNDGLPDVIERVIGTNIYQDVEKDILRPSQNFLELSDLITRSKAHFRQKSNDLTIDWSNITGSSLDKSVPFTYDSDNWTLSVVPMLKVTTSINDASTRPDDFEGPLWGEIELKLNEIVDGKTMILTVPLTSDLTKQQRNLEYFIQSQNLKGEWEELSHTVSTDSRNANFNVGAFTKLRIYYKDFGFRVSRKENNSTGGCMLRQNHHP